jgi:hypothetical protein
MTRIQTSDFDMAAALLRVLRGMWRQSFGSDFVFRAAGSTAKGAPWASFRSLRGFEKKSIEKISKPLSSYFFAPLCPLGPTRGERGPRGQCWSPMWGYVISRVPSTHQVKSSVPSSAWLSALQDLLDPVQAL